VARLKFYYLNKALVISAMSNPNGLLSQKVCCYLGQGRTLKNIEGRTLNGLL